VRRPPAKWQGVQLAGSGLTEMRVSVSVGSEAEKIRNRHRNRHLVEAGKAGKS